MRIESFRPRDTRRGLRTEATVSWEDASRPPLELFFEVSGGERENAADPNAFVAAAAVPAIRNGERRISVAGRVCPRLRDGIAAAAGLFRSWYGSPFPPPVIEPDGGFAAPRARSPRWAGIFASGGIDSSFSIRRNRRELSSAHPRSFRRVIRVHDLSFPFDASPERRLHIETRSARAVSAVAAAAGLEVTEVATNVIGIEPEFEAFTRWTHGSALAAVGLAAGNRLTDLTISASHDVWTGIRAWGSHPLLDPLFGTAATEVHHDGIETTRLEKTAEIARWPAALEVLYVCTHGPFEGNAFNCGTCEKCIRTRVALLVTGVEEPPSFPPGRVTAAEIDAIPPIPSSRRLSYYWWELVRATRESGRADIAVAIERMIERQRLADAWVAGIGWKGALRRLDQKFLGGSMLRARRRWAPP
jgi:hypothetical protein